ncbi:Uncharacterized protein Adt_03127 [Abeliophyllum distichum]|uniref:Retroviral polymerase SH3-like domain-containing protein n=1 Tax=Abeliophyllum distichum TaxID=126358 RepID=A0ABD1VXM6_9LAMI
MEITAHMLKGKMDKIESRSEAYIFVGYPKGTSGYYFYSPQDKKVFINTDATFLEDRYIEEHESNSKVLLEKNEENVPNSSILEIYIEPTLEEFMPFSPVVFGHSGRQMEVLYSMSTDLLVLKVIDDQLPIVQSSHGIETEVERDNVRKAVREQLQFSNNQEPSQLRHSGKTIQLPSRYLLHGESFEKVSIE